MPPGRLPLAGALETRHLASAKQNGPCLIERHRALPLVAAPVRRSSVLARERVTAARYRDLLVDLEAHGMSRWQRVINLPSADLAGKPLRLPPGAELSPAVAVAHADVSLGHPWRSSLDTKPPRSSGRGPGWLRLHASCGREGRAAARAAPLISARPLRASISIPHFSTVIDCQQLSSTVIDCHRLSILPTSARIPSRSTHSKAARRMRKRVESDIPISIEMGSQPLCSR